MLTVTDLNDLATYLRDAARSDRTYARRVMVCEADAAPLEQRAARLERWADALSTEAERCALATVDLPTPAAA